jgi:hypothetical protein
MVMSTATAELIFPPRIIAALKDERGPVWQELLATSRLLQDESPEQTAMTLMLARLNNCTTCTTNSYRAMQGCESCTRQSLKRFRGTDEDLVRLYHDARVEVNRHLDNRPGHAEQQLLSE